LAASWACDASVFEANLEPGGLCASHYIDRNGRRLSADSASEIESAYRFEVGGGHWIFGGDPMVLTFLERLAPMRTYERRSAVFFPDRDLQVPFPLQAHLDALPKGVAEQATHEMAQEHSGEIRTMKDWLEASFGRTLTEIFFGPFHQAYTAGLWEEIAPQDTFKSPVSAGNKRITYNSRFRYPEAGLNTMVSRLAERSTMHYGAVASRIDVRAREMHFANGTVVRYKHLLSTIPLNRMIEMCGLDIKEPPDPATSVLVLNIGARRGPRCPDVHWLYTAGSRSGFFRVGFYSNVDAGFVPRNQPELVGIYVERAFQAPHRPSRESELAYCDAVVRELQEWGFIREVEVLEPVWVNLAYTWRRPDSQWRETALVALEKEGLHMVGRYARWTFQGIADSIRDGLVAGAVFRP